MFRESAIDFPRYHGEIAVDTLLLPELVILCRDHHCDSAQDVGTWREIRDLTASQRQEGDHCKNWGICRYANPIERGKGHAWRAAYVQMQILTLCAGTHVGHGMKHGQFHLGKASVWTNSNIFVCIWFPPSIALTVCKPQDFKICSTMENKVSSGPWIGWVGTVFPRCRISSKWWVLHQCTQPWTVPWTQHGVARCHVLFSSV